MGTWPNSIKITRSNYNEKPPSRTLRSKMDIGPGKLRRRSSNAIRPLSLSLNITPDELDIFDEFYLANDSLTFDFPNPRTGEIDRARFASEPEYTHNETRWQVAVSLEILP